MWLLSANKEQTKPFIMMLNLLHLDVFYSVYAMFIYLFIFLFLGQILIKLLRNIYFFDWINK